MIRWCAGRNEVEGRRWVCKARRRRRRGGGVRSSLRLKPLVIVIRFSLNMCDRTGQDRTGQDRPEGI